MYQQGVCRVKPFGKKGEKFLPETSVVGRDIHSLAHYVHTISLDEIAAEVGMNRSAFCSYFKRCKGMTFSQFVTQYRLNTACELLKHSQKQISEICFAVGFNDVPHFNRVFKELEGVSPKDYRKINA